MASIMQRIDYRPQWKDMVVDTIEKRKQKEEEDNFADESMDRAIAAIPSAELEKGGISSERASHPSNKGPYTNQRSKVWVGMAGHELLKGWT